MEAHIYKALGFLCAFAWHAYNLPKSDIGAKDYPTIHAAHIQQPHMKPLLES